MASNTLPVGVAKQPLGRGRTGRVTRLVVPALVLASFFGVAVALQNLAGAYQAELSGYPDEPGHFVSGVLVGDYLSTFPPRAPIDFAKEFYIHRPNVAIGHWPPVLYLVEGVWFILFHASRRAALMLMALICASVAASICCVVRRWYGISAGIAAGLLFMCLGFVQTQTSEVMADMLVTFWGFWAALSFADFLNQRRSRDVYRFAIFALLAIFTKNSGIYLAFTPPLCMLLTWRFGVLRSVQLWLAAATVAVPTLVWIAWSRKFAPERLYPGDSMALFSWASRMDLSFLYLILGPCLLILIAAGVIHELLRFHTDGDALPVTLFSAALSVFVFESVAAFQGIAAASVEPRFLLPAIAALIPLLFSGLIWIGQSIGPRKLPAMARAAALLVIGILISPSRTFAIPHKPYRGFSEVADFIRSHPELRKGAIMVSTPGDGDVILTAEIVMLYPSSEGFVLRASRLLAESDWFNRSYKSRFSSTADVSRYLDEMAVDLLVIENQDGVPAPQHQDLLLQMAAEHPDHWQAVGVFPQRAPADLHGSRILVYRHVGGAVPADEKIHQELEGILRKIIGDL